mmetsp:Transcript_25864/g.30043  ORF Transcript_25864/g.30043 Transcript_25864/m.30043 type:complete len:747 (+) Transcript_25864:329-2569(+)
MEQSVPASASAPSHNVNLNTSTSININTSTSTPNPSYEDDINDDTNDTLLCLNFNQDGGCLAVGTAHGFRICNTLPFQETFRRTFGSSSSTSTSNTNTNTPSKDLDMNVDEIPQQQLHQQQQQSLQEQASNNNRETPSFTNTGYSYGGGGGIGNIEMLFRCNLLALVGGGHSPQYQKNKVFIWDDHLGRPIGELSFKHKVLNVKLRRDRICVVLRDRIYVYNFGNLALLDTIVTGNNPLGLLCISTEATGGNTSNGSSSNAAAASTAVASSPSSSPSKKKGRNLGITDDSSGMVLACPSVANGQVRVELYGKRKTLLIDAHESALASLALTIDGSLLATASERGTIIRLFSLLDHSNKATTPSSSSSSSSSLSSSNDNEFTIPVGTPLREFRRGVEHARIGSLSFSLDKCWLGCASDRGTVHIFKIYNEDEDQRTKHKSNNGTNGNHNGNQYRNSNNNNIHHHHHISRPPSGSSSAKKEKKSSTYAFTSKIAKRILPSMLTKSPKKFLLEGENSYVQVRGIPHPKICAFVPDKSHTIAVAGLDEYGNGCLLLASFGPDEDHHHLNTTSAGGTSGSKFSNGGGGGTTGGGRPTKGEARRIAYHRFFKKGTGTGGRNNYNAAKENDHDGRQLLYSNVHDNNENGNENENGDQNNIVIAAHTEKMDNLQNGVEKISFDDDADGFVSIMSSNNEAESSSSSSPEVNDGNGSNGNGKDDEDMVQKNSNTKDVTTTSTIPDGDTNKDDSNDT